MADLTYFTSFTITTTTPEEAAQIVERLGAVMMGYVMDGADCSLSVHAYDEDDEQVGEASIDSDGYIEGTD